MADNLKKVFMNNLLLELADYNRRVKRYNQTLTMNRDSDEQKLLSKWCEKLFAKLDTDINVSRHVDDVNKSVMYEYNTGTLNNSYTETLLLPDDVVGADYQYYIRYD